MDKNTNDKIPAGAVVGLVLAAVLGGAALVALSRPRRQLAAPAPAPAPELGSNPWAASFYLDNLPRRS